jgi:hypothetical protein
MRGGIFTSILVSLMAAVTLLWAPPARSANIFEKEFWMSGPRYSAKVPLCEEHGPLKMIERRFGTKEGKFWNSDLKIVGFEKIQGPAALDVLLDHRRRRDHRREL